MTNRRCGAPRSLDRDGGIALQQLWRHGHDYIFPSRLVTVEPGKIFRGAWQKPWPMRAIVHDHKIKTVLALAHPSDDPLVIRGEEARCRDGSEMGAYSHRRSARHGRQGRRGSDLRSARTGRGHPGRSQPTIPIFFHCHHGLNRTSMVQIAYRTKYCGWTLEQAADEIERTVGLVKVNHGPDYRHMVVILREPGVAASAGRQEPRRSDGRKDEMNSNEVVTKVNRCAWSCMLTLLDSRGERDYNEN